MPAVITIISNIYSRAPVAVWLDCLWIFRANLAIVKELGDRAAQGRTYGNLGNTHYLLGNFRKAVASHEQVQGTLKIIFFSIETNVCVSSGSYVF